MKKSVLCLAGFALLAAFCLPAAAQPSNRAVVTYVIDDFDNKGENEWTWNIQTSRFIDKENGYPKVGFFEGQPNSLKALNKNKDEKGKCYGVKTSYLRKGENWFEVYPEKDGKPYEIEFVGTVTQIDFWIWGANYNYFIDVLVRDAEGRVHTLPAGNLGFHGWKNCVITVPGSIRQHSRLRSGPKNMTFIGFRVRTDPDEYVDDFNIFFDQLKYTTNALSNIFDGYELSDIEFEGGSSSGSGATSEAK